MSEKKLFICTCYAMYLGSFDQDYDDLENILPSDSIQFKIWGGDSGPVMNCNNIFLSTREHAIQSMIDWCYYYNNDQPEDYPHGKSMEELIFDFGNKLHNLEKIDDYGHLLIPGSIHQITSTTDCGRYSDGENGPEYVNVFTGKAVPDQIGEAENIVDKNTMEMLELKAEKYLRKIGWKCVSD